MDLLNHKYVDIQECKQLDILLIGVEQVEQSHYRGFVAPTQNIPFDVDGTDKNAP